MFGIGFFEIIVILIVALLVVGPTKLPEVARSIGRALGEFRRMADDVKETFEEEFVKEDGHAEESREQFVKEDEHTEEPREQVTPQEAPDPSSGQKTDEEPKKDVPHPDAEKGA
jgi:Tat protein translocase TatB subunit